MYAIIMAEDSELTIDQNESLETNKVKTGGIGIECVRRNNANIINIACETRHVTEPQRKRKQMHAREHTISFLT